MGDITISEDSVDVLARPAAVSPLALIERAVMSGAGVETIEKLMALQERFEANKARRAFDAAIAAARAKMKPIAKTAEVDFTSSKGRTSYKHETLDAIAAQIDPILAEHGLSYRFRSAQQNGGLSVTCIVAHRDGHSEETSLFGPPDQSGSKNAYQAIGSAATYLQRYTLKLSLGLSAAKDDDASGAAPQGRQEPVQRSGPDPEAVQHAISALRACESVDALRDVWATLPGVVKRVPAVVSAKDGAKAAIEADSAGKIIDDKISF